jgi:hypothetical protein
MKSNKDIVSQFYNKNGHYHISMSGLRKQKDEDRMNRGFYSGDEQFICVNLDEEARKYYVTMNRTKPYVDSIVGFMAQHRRKPEYNARIPNQAEQEARSAYMNAMSDYVRDDANAEEIETQQDLEQVISGYGAVATDITYDATTNPSGDIIMAECTEDVYWDPESRATNLLDSRWCFVKKLMPVEDAVAMYGGEESDYEDVDLDERTAYKYWAEGGIYTARSFDWDITNRTMVNVCFYEWYDIEKYYSMENPILDPLNQDIAQFLMVAFDLLKKKQQQMLEDADEVEDMFSFDPTQEIITMTAEEYAAVKAILDEYGIKAVADSGKRRVHYRAILSGEKVFKKFKLLSQTGFSIKFKTGFFDKNRKLWFGIVTSLREPQRYYNKALSEFVKIIASTAKPGVLYNVDAVENAEEFEDLYQKAASAIGVRDISGIRNKQEPYMPSGLENLAQEFAANLSAVSNINPEFLGQSNNSQISGVLEATRIKQVMASLALYFNSGTLYLKEQARMMVPYFKVLARNSKNRLIPILGERGVMEYAKLSENQFAAEYDVDVGEAPVTPAQKELVQQSMMAYVDKAAMVLAQTAPQKAIDLYREGIDYLPIKQADKVKWKKLLEMPQPDPQQAAMEAELAQRNASLDMAFKEAMIKEKEANTLYRTSTVDKTVAETDRTEAEFRQKELENLAISTNPLPQPTINI